MEFILLFREIISCSLWPEVMSVIYNFIGDGISENGNSLKDTNNQLYVYIFWSSNSINNEVDFND